MPLAEFAARAPALLEEIQQGLFTRARAFRDERSVALGTSGAVLEYFGAGEGGAGKTGFARVHVAEDAAVSAALDPLKVTVRCIPMEGQDEPGPCVFTGRPVPRPSILARAY